jgi:hypothetical protein
MTWLGGALTFIAGLVIAIQWLAAVHSIVDLWYTMRTAWRVVSVRVIRWSAVAVASFLVVGDRHRAPLLAGMAFYGIVFVGTYTFMIIVGGLRPRRTPTVE